MCIDMRTLKVFFEISNADDDLTHAQANKLVLDSSNKGDDLASRALRAMFRSRTGYADRKRKK